MLEVYHGTTKEIAQKILRENFKIIHKEVTNDLGNGVYTYCPDEENIWDPQITLEDTLFSIKMERRRC